MTDPFGRDAILEYDESGRLERITDMIGIESAFTYGSGDRVESLTTPYGPTSFERKTLTVGESGTRWLEITDPQGDKERIEFGDPGPEIPGIHQVPESVTIDGEKIFLFAESENRLQYRNSYHWTKEAMHKAPLDYSAAKNYRWLTDTDWVVTNVLEAVKEPLEERVWFNYPGGTGTSTS